MWISLRYVWSKVTIILDEKGKQCIWGVAFNIKQVIMIWTENKSTILDGKSNKLFYNDKLLYQEKIIE